MDHNDTSTDRSADHEWIDDLGKRAGAAIRPSAPAAGLAELQRRKSVRTAKLAATTGAVAVLLLGAILYIANRKGVGEDQTIATQPTSTAPSLATSIPAVLSTAAPVVTTVTTGSLTPTTPTTTVVNRSIADLPSGVPFTDVVTQTVEAPAPAQPTLMGLDGETFWVSNATWLQRFSVSTGEFLGAADGVALPSGFQVARPTAGFGSIWVPGAGSIKRVDPVTYSEIADIPIPGGTIETFALWISDITAGPTGIWALSHDEVSGAALVRIDPATNQLADRVPIGPNGRSIGFAAGSIWVTHSIRGHETWSVSRHDLTTGEELARIELPYNPGIVIGDADSVWINGQFTNSLGGREEWALARIDPSTNSVAAILKMPALTLKTDFGVSWTDVAVGGDSVWVTTTQGLVQVDKTSNRVKAIYQGLTGGGVVATADVAWVSDTATSKLYRIPAQ